MAACIPPLESLMSPLGQRCVACRVANTFHVIFRRAFLEPASLRVIECSRRLIRDGTNDYVWEFVFEFSNFQFVRFFFLYRRIFFFLEDLKIFINFIFFSSKNISSFEFSNFQFVRFFFYIEEFFFSSRI